VSLPEDRTIPHDLADARTCPAASGYPDLFASGAQQSWYDSYVVYHREAPVVRYEGEGLFPGTDAYLLTKYEDVSKVVKDWPRFTPITSLSIAQMTQSDEPLEGTPSLGEMLRSMVTLRPDQRLWRTHRQTLTDPWVGPGSKRHHDMVVQHVNDLIDTWGDAREIDFVRQFARPLPQRVFASVLGFKQADVPRLAAWGDALVTPFVHGTGPRHMLNEEQTSSKDHRLRGFTDFIRQTVREKVADPADDMISFLAETIYEPLARKLTPAEIEGIVYAMTLGALETTQYALSEQAILMCNEPGLFQKVKRDPSLVRPFVEESLRLRSPTHGISTRITTQDEVFQGVKVPAQSLLHLRYAAANVDPDEFACPYDFQIDRKAVTRHLAFSAGERVCPGAGLSRLEQNIAWERLLDRLASIEQVSGETLEYQPGIMLGLRALQVRVTLEPAA
jgi:cytochrome P450